MEPDLIYWYDCKNWGELVSKLRYFRFHESYQIGDAFWAMIPYYDRADLIEKMKKLGIPPVPFVEGEQLPKQTVYPVFSLRMPDFPDLREPSWTTIHGIICYVTAKHGNMIVTVSGTDIRDIYSLTVADCEACLQLEEVFDQVGLHQPH
jgi:hypothetical protein